MNRTRSVGVALTTVGVAGYLAGVATPYPGRAFTVTAVIVGITLASIGGDGSDGDDHDRATERRDDEADADGGGREVAGS